MTLAEYEKDANHIAINFIKYYYSKLSTDSSKLFQLYASGAVLKHMDSNSDPLKGISTELSDFASIKKYWKSIPSLANAKIVLLTANTIQNSDNSLMTTVVGEILLKEDYERETDDIFPTRLFTQTFILQPHPKKDNYDIKSDILSFIPDTDFMDDELEEEPVSAPVVEEFQPAAIKTGTNGELTKSNEETQQEVVEQSSPVATSAPAVAPVTPTVASSPVTKIKDEKSNGSANGSVTTTTTTTTTTANKKMVKNTTASNTNNTTTPTTEHSAQIQKRQASPTPRSVPTSSSSPSTVTSSLDSALNPSTNTTTATSASIEPKIESPKVNEKFVEKSGEKAVEKTAEKPVEKKEPPKQASKPAQSTSSTSNDTTTKTTPPATKPTTTSVTKSPVQPAATIATTTPPPATTSPKQKTPPPVAKEPKETKETKETKEPKQSPVTQSPSSWASALKSKNGSPSVTPIPPTPIVQTPKISPIPVPTPAPVATNSTPTPTPSNNSSSSSSSKPKNNNRSNEDYKYEIYVTFKDAIDKFVEEDTVKSAFSANDFKHFTVVQIKNLTSIVGFSSADEQAKALKAGKISNDGIDFTIEKREKKNKKPYKGSNNSGNNKRK